MTDIREVDTLVCEARRDLLPFFLHFEYYREETFYVRGRDIVTVRSLYQGLPLEVEDSNKTCHS